jgi:RNA polymerase sigma-70 factor (ECF subfamily)
VLPISELIQLCVDGNALARSEFAARFHKNIAGAVVKVTHGSSRRDPELIRELIQDVYVKLFRDTAKSLRDLRDAHEGAVVGLVQAVAYSVACDYFRGRGAHKRGGTAKVVALDDPETPQPELKGGESSILDRILFLEIDRALSEVLDSGEHCCERTVFWLYYRHGLTANDIARLRLTDLSAKGIESLLRRLTKGIREKLLEGKTAGFPSLERGGA